MREVAEAVEQANQERKLEQQLLDNYLTTTLNLDRHNKLVPRDQLDKVINALYRTGRLSDSIEISDYGISRGSNVFMSTGDRYASIIGKRRGASERSIVSFEGVTTEELKKFVEQRMQPPSSLSMQNLMNAASGSDDPLTY